MDSTYITAIAAACGSLVGAAATSVTTWITQHTQRVHAEREERLRNREALYGEFITEASCLAVDAFSHSLERPETFVKLYGITGRIRLMATGPVLDAAEACIRQIIDLYAKPNMTVEQIRLAFERDRIDPIRDFSVGCRKELLEIAGGR
ncbi:MAG: hypothetical protein ACHQ5A_12060 [Opitutales bacterium]